MKGKVFGEWNENEIKIFLLLYRFTTLMFSMIVLLIKNEHQISCTIHSGLFVLLTIYNILLTVFFWKYDNSNNITMIAATIDILMGVIVIGLTGNFVSTYFYYSLGSIFLYVFLYRVRGAVNRLNVKSKRVEEFKQNLFYLYEIACIINISHSLEDMMNRMIGICQEIFNGRFSCICLIKDSKPVFYGKCKNKQQAELNKLIREYIAKWKHNKINNSYTDGTDIVIPITRGSRLEGVIIFDNQINDKKAEEDIALVKIISNMISSYIENNQLIKMMQQGLLISERKRIARDIHDGLAQSLFFFSAEIQNCRRLVKKKDSLAAEEKLVQLQKGMASCFQEVRSYIYSLKNDDINNESILETLTEYLKKININFDIDIQYVPKIEREISQEIGESLFRILQEGVNNVIKHARASKLTIHLEVRDEITLTLKDNGTGFDMDEVAQYNLVQPKFGLSSMRERVEYLGGQLHIETSHGVGTLLHILIPNHKGGSAYEANKITGS